MSNTQVDYKAYRQEKTDEGVQYQDFVVDALYAEGFPVITYSSQKYQYGIGESKGGWEIKYDMKYHQTKNLWIEVEEKACPRSGPYAKSGIMRENTSVFYVIGDRSTIFVFPITTLRLLYNSGKFRIIENSTKTSRGFLLPHVDAMLYAAFIVGHRGGRLVRVKPSPLPYRFTPAFLDGRHA